MSERERDDFVRIDWIDVVWGRRDGEHDNVRHEWAGERVVGATLGRVFPPARIEAKLAD